MTQKVNGAAYPGIWVEKQVTFVKLTFSGNIAAIPASNLVEMGTSIPVSAGTVADASFGVVESALVQALKTLEMKATVLGISSYNSVVGLPAYFSATGGTTALGTLVGGGGYTPGTYTNVPLNGGNGYGSLGTVVVNGAGVVSSVTITAAGAGYAPGTALTAPSYLLGVPSTPTPFNVLVSTTSGTFGVSSAGNVVTVGSTAGLTPGMVIGNGGDGAFLPGTTVVSVTDGTHFVVSNAPTTPLSSSTTVIYGFNGSVSTVDVMLGYAEGWFSDASGVIATGLPIGSGVTVSPNVPPQFYGINAVITTAGAGSAFFPDTVGTLVNVLQGAYTFDMEFVQMNGTMPVATFANGGLAFGPGSTSGAFPPNSPTGTPGYYPVELITA